MENEYYVYMLRCMNESIYTGITNDIERRMMEHFSKDKKCAKYTATHTAKKLEAFWKTENRQLASKLEFYIKSLTRLQKEKLIENSENLEKFLGNKIEVNMYERCKLRDADYTKEVC